MQPEVVAKHVQDLEVAVGDVDRRIFDLVVRAAALASDEGLADRPESFRAVYVEAGEREILPRLDRILATLAELDPDRRLEQSWVCALECKANYYLRLVASVKDYRDRLAGLMRRPPTPFAPPEVADAARQALAVCEQIVALPAYGWIARKKLAEVRWLLEDRAGAIAALEGYLDRSASADRRQQAHALLETIRAFAPPAPTRG